MVSGTLFTYPDSFRGYKSQVAAAFSGFSLKVVEVQLGDKTQKNVPSFVTEDKSVSLIEPNSISYYVANEQLRGGAALDQRTEVIQWLNYSSTDVASAVASWVYPSLSLVEASEQDVVRAKSDLKNVFAHLNEFLKTRTFFVGERITLADVALACDLLLAYRHVACEEFRKPYANLNRWFNTLVNQPQFLTVVGPVVFCVTAETFDANKHAAVKEETRKATKVANAKPAKPAKAPAAKKVVEKEEEPEEDLEAQENAGKVDPFAAMPKGTFNMDEFKRVYSNMDTEKEAIPYFWTNFDAENYSIWYAEYKYADELSQVFMSSNLIGGMFQRIEKLRKNAFASIAVFGEANNNTIAGVWVWKGKDLVFPLCQDWTTDYESYEWTKLNPTEESTKTLVNNFWKWEGQVKGKSFAAGKIFK